MKMENEIKTAVENQTPAEEIHDKNAYKEKIRELSAEDQAFMDGYLFAKLTSQKTA